MKEKSVVEKLGITPGPWEKDFGGTVGHIKSTAKRDDGRTPTVCKYIPMRYGTISIEEAEMNANVIAAVPEMLEALIEDKEDAESCLMELEKYCPDINKVYNIICRIMARSSISSEKATGKTWDQIKELL